MNDRAAHQVRVVGLAFAPNGKLLASGSLDKSVRLWDAASGNPISVFVNPGGGVGKLTISPNSRLLALPSDDHTVRLWRMPE